MCDWKVKIFFDLCEELYFDNMLLKMNFLKMIVKETSSGQLDMLNIKLMDQAHKKLSSSNPLVV